MAQVGSSCREAIRQGPKQLSLKRTHYSPPDQTSPYCQSRANIPLEVLRPIHQGEHLSCKTPHNVERELRMHLLMHNLVRRLMLESSRRAGVSLSRISFAGALAVARRYGETLLQARSRRKRVELIDELYRVLAADLVPDRPGRREPRAVKRRPKPYPRLMCHRSKFKETPHPNRYWKGSPCLKKSRRYLTNCHSELTPTKRHDQLPRRGMSNMKM